MDTREEIYRDLYERQLQSQERDNAHSARVILQKVLALNPASSALDVGCGLGTWLAACKELGVSDIAGIEGEWIDEAEVKVPRESIKSFDLERPFDLGKRFDLLITTEVAEHLSPQAAHDFVASLVRHSDCIVFSAAIPFQGGHHHVNEQFLSYWADLFAAKGFCCIDCLRVDLWHDPQILWWLRQNIVIFANDNALSRNKLLRAERDKPRGPLSIVHPDVYMSRLTSAQTELDALRQLAQMLSQAGTYKVRIVDGMPTLRRTGK